MGSAEKQGPLWGAAPRDWAEIAEPGQVPFYEAAFDALGVEPELHCSTSAVGPASRCSWRTSAVRRSRELTPPRACSRWLAERVPDGDLRHGDIEELPFADGTFDAVTAFNSVQYATDPAAALREIKRVAKRGAGVAIATWGTADQCEMRVSCSEPSVRCCHRHLRAREVHLH